MAVQQRKKVSLVEQARQLAGKAPEEPFAAEEELTVITAWDGRVRRSPVQPLRDGRKKNRIPWLAALGVVVLAAVVLAVWMLL